jgi:hypothetical protein
MKINLTKEVNEDTLMSHMIVNGIANNDWLIGQIVKEGTTQDGVVCDIVVTVNGHEIDLNRFVDEWQNQVKRIIRKEAEEIVTEKFNDITWLFSDLDEMIKNEISKRLEDWEKEDVE